MDCTNTIKCPCTYANCSRHGKCCECIAYHLRRGEAPGCLFSKTAEKTYDRSIESLYKDSRSMRNA